MTDYLVSLIRTAIPAGWGAVLAWLVGLNLLPVDLVAQAEGFAVVITAVAVALFYAVVRWLETRPWFPVWLSRLLLGSSKPPTYLGTVPVGGREPKPPYVA